VVLTEWFKGVGTMKTCTILLISTTLLFQGIFGQNLLDALRNIIKALDGGETDSESGIDINVLRKLPIPPDFIPEEFKAIKKRMCNNQPPKRCLCEDGAKLKEINIDPNNDGKHATLEDILKIYSSCRPIKCECRDGEEQLVTNLGCISGGVPRCRDTNNQVRNSSKSLIMPDPLFCNRRNSDQQRELKFWDLVEARFQDEDKQRCICRSNLFPVCQSGLPPRCPDGSKPLKRLTILPPFLDLCDHSDD